MATKTQKSIIELASEHNTAQLARSQQWADTIAKHERNNAALAAIQAEALEAQQELEAAAASGTVDGAAYAEAAQRVHLASVGTQRNNGVIDALRKRVTDAAVLPNQLVIAEAAAHALQASGVIAAGVPIVAALPGFKPQERCVVLEADIWTQANDSVTAQLATGLASGGLTIRQYADRHDRVLAWLDLYHRMDGWRADKGNEVMRQPGPDGLEVVTIGGYFEGPVVPLVITTPSAPRIAGRYADWVSPFALSRMERSRIVGTRDSGGKRFITMESLFHVSWPSGKHREGEAPFEQQLRGQFLPGVGVVTEVDVEWLAGDEHKEFVTNIAHGPGGGVPQTHNHTHSGKRLRITGESIAPKAAQ